MDDIDLMISRYNNIKRKIDSSFSSFDGAISKLKKAGENLCDGVILEGKAYDNGRLNQCAIVLSNISSNLNSISRNCSYKINSLYRQKALLEAKKKSSENASSSFEILE